ncbi:MAG: hypothetical protein QF486_06085 [Candidatus Woesearchaeota archaeon]|jgi:hypothetical protein|nr:hypothetical protein [Candidatus Woesearchaeota archaeon]MDP7180908.1 hypothetical protein [Candidatus Woesearchaeota archaeon]MDP7199155.1 hypothetical protein [Candidatus Woesearchaeota archaeon]MDP7467582.1 hypothetical protein [Candidatus Woesearchaeota archaeon]MDP7647064.1 hypothetical protein [Candidatus Woesearchaeota archaeon]|tara:strand:- start:999 stop:1214 length:216 start_codon:yes stop_codon:yes gene_type:complete
MECIVDHELKEGSNVLFQMIYENDQPGDKSTLPRGTITTEILTTEPRIVDICQTSIDELKQTFLKVARTVV